MERKSSAVRLFLIGLFFAATLLACDLGGGSKPTTVITAPPHGSTYNEGDDVAVQSTSADASGVTRIELSVDGAVVRNDTPPSPQTNFSIIQNWKATQGTHTLTVRAYNAAGAASDPAAVSIQVGPSVALNPTPTATFAPSVPTTVAPPTSVPPITAPPVPGACTNNSAFVTDVTVPDGTNFSAGQTFNKIWKLSNTGTCAWGTGYQLVFISGEAMTSSTVVSVPATASGATADILVPMTAPATAGDHTGSWRMRSADGAVFGQTVTVKITVPGAPPPPSSGCSGNPVIASFTVASATITAGSSTTLNWGAVTNADSVEIDHGIGGVPAPGSTSVSPGSTTTYTMTAHCGPNTATAQVTITVNPVLPPPAIAPSTTQILKQVSVPAGSVGSATASCPSGSVVTGGGFASQSSLSTLVYTQSQSGNGWQVYLNNTTGSSQLLNAYAICLSGTSGSTTQVLKQVSVPANGNGSATATCTSGIVTGGGFASQSSLSTEVYTQSKSGNGWQAYLKNGTTSSQLVNAYAICLTGTSGTSTQILKQVSISAHTTGSATADCPGGSVLTGGGFASQSDLSTKVYTQSKTGNSWQVYLNNNTGSSQLLNAYAICVSF